MIGYISRVNDMVGRIELTLLQVENLANPDRPVERIVAESAHRNPYTLESMDYDPASGWLSFECLDNTSDACVLEIGRL